MLQADAYGGYEKIYDTGRVDEALCWRTRADRGGTCMTAKAASRAPLPTRPCSASPRWSESTILAA